MNLAEIKNRDFFGNFLNQHGLTGIGVEIGVFQGAYSKLIRDTWRGRLLVGVDPYVNYPVCIYKDNVNKEDMAEVKRVAIEAFSNVKGYELRIVPSLESVRQFNDGNLDFVYIDGNHQYESAKEDLEAWWSKVKPGGIVGLHDFYTCDTENRRCNVAKAVWEFCYKNALIWTVTPCTSAWILKP